MNQELIRIIQNIQSQIKEGLFYNEATVIRGIINPILNELGWPISDVRVVRPEFTLETQRIDIALFHNNQPFIFIEAKKIGGADGAERQLFEYAFHLGVPILILTDGPTWHFFLTAGIGSYEQRKVNRLDLIEYEDLEQLCSKFDEYLNYTNVISGKAQKYLEEDYKSVIREKEIKRTLPIAWNKLIEEKDELLFEILGSKVEELCNYKPPKDIIFEFLAKEKSKLSLEIPKSQVYEKLITTKGNIRIKPSGSLGFTRIISSHFGNSNPGNRWANLVKIGIEFAIQGGYSITDLQQHTSINLINGEERERGYKFIPKVGISYQGMDATKTWGMHLS